MRDKLIDYEKQIAKRTAVMNDWAKFCGTVRSACIKSHRLTELALGGII